MIKGPLILMVVGLAAATLIILDRSARWLLALPRVEAFNISLGQPLTIAVFQSADAP